MAFTVGSFVIVNATNTGAMMRAAGVTTREL